MQRNEQLLPEWWPQRLEAIEQFADWSRGGRPPEWPLEIFLEVSNLCDLKCAMCPTFSALSPSRLYSIKEQERGFLDITALKERLDPILRRAIAVHCFGYGEPTLHTGFLDLLNHLGDYHLLIDFFTNGMHLDQMFCEQLVARKVFSMTVSASGADPVAYESIYLGGRFETLLEGLRMLRDAKQAAGSPYPRVEINSIAFDHHVRRLPEFVDLMADCGVEVIHLKTLQTFRTTQELQGHRSILRPWVEGEILIEAERRAQEHGMVISTDQYRLTEVQDEVAWQQAKGNTSSTVPLDAIAEAARKVKPLRPSSDHVSPRQVDAMQLHPDALAEAFESFDLKAEKPFYCFEPFKTLYVRRSGHVKPCCFANDSGPSLGNLMELDAESIWNGLPLRTLRTGILAQRYPNSLCGHCLTEQYGPRQQDIPNRLRQYRFWLESASQIQLPIELPTQTLSNLEIVTRWRESERCDAELSLFLEEIRRLAPFGIPSNLLEGHLDGLQGQTLHGWLYAPGLSHLHLSVSISLDGNPWRTVKADQFRDDLLAASKGDGVHAFMISLAEAPPYSLIEVWLAETDWLLGRIESACEDLSSDDQTSNDSQPIGYHPFLLDYQLGIHEKEIFRYFASQAAKRTPSSLPREHELPKAVLIIVFTNHCGSSLLANALSATGLFNQAFECFDAERVIEVCSRKGIRDLSGYLGYLTQKHAKHGNLAIKLSWDQLFFVSRTGIIPNYWPRVRFVWSLREDLIAQSISYIVAERTANWKGDDSSLAPQSILADLSPADLVPKLEETTFSHRQLWSYFSLYGVEPVTVLYEDLLADPESEIRHLLEQTKIFHADRPWRFDADQILVKKQHNPEMEASLIRLKRDIHSSLFGLGYCDA